MDVYWEPLSGPCQVYLFSQLPLSLLSPVPASTRPSPEPP